MLPVFLEVKRQLDALGFSIATMDDQRPWGGFFVLEETQALKFKDHFFPDVTFTPQQASGKLSPKILMVAPEKRLSWQYHFRRAEIWKLIDGEAGIVRSASDTEAGAQPLEVGRTVRLEKGERHRLVGLKQWGVVAEIWMHTDAEHPSDENDIVRIQDDFGR
jgi:mannose-6-phosphate isomerase-like protein (cupin superfamily)